MDIEKMQTAITISSTVGDVARFRELAKKTGKSQRELFAAAVEFLVARYGGEKVGE